MATYAELFGIATNDTLRNKVAVAIIVAADTIRTEAAGTTNHANRLLWAHRALQDPSGMAKRGLWAVLAANKGATVANIEGATDAAIQANVDAVVDVFADGSE